MSVKPAKHEKASFDSAIEYLYLRIYEFFYLTGIRFIRQMRGGFHFVVNQFIYIKNGVIDWFKKTGRHIYNSLRNVLTGKYHAFLSYSNKAADAFETLRNSKEKTAKLIKKLADPYSTVSVSIRLYSATNIGSIRHVVFYCIIIMLDHIKVDLHPSSFLQTIFHLLKNFSK